MGWLLSIWIGPVGALLINYLNTTYRNWQGKVLIGGILVFAIFLNVGLYIRSQQEQPDFNRQTEVAKRVGEKVNHSKYTILLDPNGTALRYYGEFSGIYWPYRGEMLSSLLWGEKELSVEDRFDYITRAEAAEYFIVTDFEEFEAQKDLKHFILTQYEEIDNEEGFLIFNLRK
jgi:hypothetical protein